ncbi:hypothetical protein [Evansella clarkii]|uniref:hypothetical protein n=1 Tax=Evansella clarkii TaxID=79879 RepID=UPI000B43C874|nr:hypothetical protein [Evansella clarkii]
MKKYILGLSIFALLVGCNDSGEDATAAENNSDIAGEEEIQNNQDNETNATVEESQEENTENEVGNNEENNENEYVEEEYDEIEAYNRLKGAMESIDRELVTETVEGSSGQSHVFEVITDGMVKFITNNTGSSNFNVTIENGETGERMGQVANDIGDFSGHQFLYLEEGEYILQVKSNGDWVIDIEQPFLHEIIYDKKFSGHGHSTVGPLTTSSNRIELIVTHNGDSNFSVHILDVLGGRQGMAFNEIGDYEGNHITSILPDTIFYLDIRAGGDWEIEIKE